MTFIKNNHISLRALERGDLEYLYQLENKESARQFGDDLMPHSKYVLKSFIRDAHKDIYESRQLRLVIEHNEDCEPIGMIDLFNFAPHHKRAEVGVWIDEQYREQNFAAEALSSLCDYAFDTLLIHQLFCHISENNKKSIELFQKSGFSTSGMLKDWIYDNYNHSNVLILQKINPKTEKKSQIE